MLELTRSGELLGDEYRADEPLGGPIERLFKRLFDFKPGCGTLMLKGPPAGLSSTQHLLSSAVLQHFYTGATHLHGILNITVHQPP